MHQRLKRPDAFSVWSEDLGMVRDMASGKGDIDFNFNGGTVEQHLDFARQADQESLRALARRYDWLMFPEPVLGWIMAQKSIDLGTALTVFFNGDPTRFNYIPKRDVPQEYRGYLRVLDLICLRINSGFYLVWPESDVAQTDMLANWLNGQRADREEGRSGRFVLDEAIVDMLTKKELCMLRERETPVYDESRSLLKEILSPVMQLGVSRQLLRYHPPDEDKPSDLSNFKY